MTFVVAWFWLGELPALLSLLGGVLALLGIVVVAFESKERHQSVSASKNSTLTASVHEEETASQDNADTSTTGG